MEQYVPPVHSPAVNAMGLISQVVQPVLINTTLMVLAAGCVCTNAFNVMMVLLVIDAIQHTMSMGLLNAHCAPSIVFHVFTTYLQPRPAVRLVKILMDSAGILLTLAPKYVGICLPTKLPAITIQETNTMGAMNIVMSSMDLFATKLATLQCAPMRMIPLWKLLRL